MRRPARSTCRTACVLLAGVALTGGCSTPSPMAQQNERALRRIVTEAAQRELEQAQQQGKQVTLTRESGLERLGVRPATMQELERMAGPGSYDPSRAPLGEDLLGAPARTVVLSLERAIKTAAANNIAVQFARLGPAINEAQVAAAEASFDWVLFSNLNFNNTDQQRVQTSLGLPRVSDQAALTNTTGLRRTLIGGGRLTVQQELGYTDDTTPGQSSNPNPAEQLAFAVQYDQPLLKNMGSEVSQSEIRLARNAERTAVQTLKRDLIRTLADTEKTYWQLVQAHRELFIQQRLLERGETVRDQMEKRGITDATQAQIADARARAERRKADLLRAQTNLRGVSDRLKVLMNDPELPVGSELIVIPSDAAVDEPIRFSLLDCVRAAVQYRPEVQQAILGIDDASIRRIVADNARRADLALRLQARSSALSDNLGKDYRDIWDARFVDYLVGLTFEVPIGNRKAESDFRRRSLERTQTVVAYRNTVQSVTQEVKTALDRIVLNYRLIEQTRVSRIAAANVLRTLLIENQTTSGLSPERLDLELNRHESLAQAEREEVQALTDYNSAIADLYLAMGTLLDRDQIKFIVPTADDAPWRSSAREPATR